MVPGGVQCDQEGCKDVFAAVPQGAITSVPARRGDDQAVAGEQRYGLPAAKTLVGQVWRAKPQGNILFRWGFLCRLDLSSYQFCTIKLFHELFVSSPVRRPNSVAVELNRPTSLNCRIIVPST